jgi:hypothetical protein
MDVDMNMDVDMDGHGNIEFIRTPEYRTFPYAVSPGPEWKKLTMSEPVQYWTEPMDAGMPMPALVFWMPMPSYAKSWVEYLAGSFQAWLSTV